ncbi:MAG: hypothetical protein V1820_02870 [archaeon]
MPEPMTCESCIEKAEAALKENDFPAAETYAVRAALFREGSADAEKVHEAVLARKAAYQMGRLLALAAECTSEGKYADLGMRSADWTHVSELVQEEARLAGNFGLTTIANSKADLVATDSIALAFSELLAELTERWAAATPGISGKAAHRRIERIFLSAKYEIEKDYLADCERRISLGAELGIPPNNVYARSWEMMKSVGMEEVSRYPTMLGITE